MTGHVPSGKQQEFSKAIIKSAIQKVCNEIEQEADYKLLGEIGSTVYYIQKMFNGKPLIIEAIDTTFDNPGNPPYDINEFIEQKYELMPDMTFSDDITNKLS